MYFAETWILKPCFDRGLIGCWELCQGDTSVTRRQHLWGGIHPLLFPGADQRLKQGQCLLHLLQYPSFQQNSHRAKADYSLQVSGGSSLCPFTSLSFPTFLSHSLPFSLSSSLSFSFCGLLDNLLWWLTKYLICHSNVCLKPQSYLESHVFLVQSQ